VELALIAPIMLVIALAIIDLARIYTTMLTVESAAREAADFGTFGSQKWNDAAVAVVPDGTEAKMKRRACVASSALPDYVGPDDACTNPTFSYQLSGDRGANWAPYDPVLACDDSTREPPCWLKVTLQYNFRLLVPFNFEFLGTSYGVPNTLTFERSSIFPMTDLDIP
jgi:TadE-like protein.